MNEDNLDGLENIFSGIEDFDGEYNVKNIASELGLDLTQLEEQMNGYQPNMVLEYSSSNNDSINPKYAYPTDSGFDLYSVNEVRIGPFDRALIPTGLHFNIPDGYEIQVRSKSGLALKQGKSGLALKQGLMVLNSPGTVDQGYTGEIKVILFNTTNNEVIIEKGQKIAQGVISPVVAGKWVNLVKTSNIEDKDRSDKGFGSTGV
jgi:dUTP pyrophosphatase